MEFIKKKKDLLFVGLILFIVLFIFRSWFSLGNLSSGDWIFYYPRSIQDIFLFSLWDTRHLGLGGSNLPTLWLESYLSTTIQVARFIPWALYERIFWHFPVLIFSFISSFLLARYVIKNTLFSFLASLIYTLNTYILLVLIGNQLGVALAYGFAPFTIHAAIKLLFDNTSFRQSIILGLLLGILGVFDIRLFYIIVFGIGVLYLFSVTKKDYLKKAGLLIFSFILVIGIHLFWILPILITQTNPINLVGEEYTGVNSVRFFSFAKLETAMSFLHPNWPENIFGKVAFQRPEFLIITLLTISSLFYIFKSKKSLILLGLVGLFLLGVFMSKGANDPFGELYIKFFQYVPGFKMFRDPTKWYLLIAISLSVLIPFTLLSISKNSKVRIALFIVFVFFWLLTVKEVFTMQKGSLITHPIPTGYQRFADKLSMDDTFYRVLWVPRHQRYGYYSHYHPAVNFQELGIPIESLTSSLDKRLDKLNVRYVAIPIDSDKEIFIKDREYNENVKQQAIKAVEKLGYVRTNEFDELVIFENLGYKDRVFSDLMTQSRITSSNPISFNLDINSSGSGMIYLSENYDSGWKLLLSDGTKINSEKRDSINAFQVGPFKGRGEIMYEPQKFVYIGLLISGIIVIGSVGYLLFRR